MTNITDKKAVIVFAKFPAEGKVKTRLAAGAGAERAVSFYKKCCEYIFNMLKNFHEENSGVYLFYSVNDSEEKVRQWVGRPFNFIRQNPGNLGDKMRNAFSLLFGEGYENVLIIGTDIPDLTENDLTEAFNKLSDSDIVIGPADDGGYYLLGLKSPADELFTGIPWSGEAVLDFTMDAIRKSGKSFSLLNKLHDIDDVEALKNWIDESDGNGKLKAKMRDAAFAGVQRE